MSHLHRRRRRRRRFDAASSRFLTVTFLFEQGCYILSQEKEVGVANGFLVLPRYFFFHTRRKSCAGKKRALFPHSIAIQLIVFYFNILFVCPLTLKIKFSSTILCSITSLVSSSFFFCRYHVVFVLVSSPEQICFHCGTSGNPKRLCAPKPERPVAHFLFCTKNQRRTRASSSAHRFSDQRTLSHLSSHHSLYSSGW